MLKSIEICAGAGGQAVGLEYAGFKHQILVEIDKDACKTLRYNRPNWNVSNSDVKDFSAKDFKDIDLLAGGVPCPPFSVAGKQLGDEDDRDLFPEALRLISECSPKAVMLENVRGIFDKKFDAYRESIISKLEDLGYICHWRLVNSSDYNVPQLRPRSILIALKEPYASHFIWPSLSNPSPPTVGEVLYEQMSSNGWKGAADWAKSANDIAPTLVGGSKKHGGPDLGPTRAKKAWLKLGVDGRGIATEPPSQDFHGFPKLTVPMAALIQGFPSDWVFVGCKTNAYRQVGNAFPPPVAQAFGEAIKRSIENAEQECAASDPKKKVSRVAA